MPEQQLGSSGMHQLTSPGRGNKMLPLAVLGKLLMKTRPVGEVVDENAP